MVQSMLKLNSKSGVRLQGGFDRLKGHFDRLGPAPSVPTCSRKGNEEREMKQSTDRNKGQIRPNADVA